MKHTISQLPLTNSFARLPGQFYSRVKPTPYNRPAELIHFNAAAAALLDLDPAARHDVEFVKIFSGELLPEQAEPLAMLYAGHQFGHFVPQLGDGRAIMLDETTNQQGEKWELQLKGSGLTPYSRDGDGRAVLRSTIREYLCSEAMHGLGIPTTRALCITGSDDEVYRENIETAAILTRLAPSHVRFGSFEVFYYRNQHDEIKTLADYVIEHHYPELKDNPQPYQALLETVIDRTANLIARWQAVGFSHGVMNTDNMSILGLTLDYGPYGFMEAYNPRYICNHSDYQGRYAFDQQPQVGLFNVSCLAQALLPLLDLDAAKAALEDYLPAFTKYYYQLMVNKLGFIQVNEQNIQLVNQLLEQIQQSSLDYTNLFRSLAGIERDNELVPAWLRDQFLHRAQLDRWYHDYRQQLQQHQLIDNDRRELMNSVNPKYILRNYMAQVAIKKAEQKDYTEIEKLMSLLGSPFEEHPEMEHYAAPPPDWASDIQVSCSS